MPRGRKKGCPKTGGRVKGSINKINSDIVTMLDSMGCNPFEGMAKIANDEEIPNEIRLRAYTELAQYCLPKKRAVEHTGPGGGPLELNVNPVDSLISRIAQLAPSGSTRGPDPKPSGV